MDGFFSFSRSYDNMHFFDKAHVTSVSKYKPLGNND
jgi:hypothetical protein